MRARRAAAAVLLAGCAGYGWLMGVELQRCAQLELEYRRRRAEGPA